MAKKIRTWVTDKEDAERKAAKAAAAAIPKPLGNPAWKKGKSPNPGGRPKGYFSGGLGELCRVGTEYDLKVVNRIIRSPKSSDALKLQAINLKWDRGWGRPQQNVTIEQKHLRAMTDDELTAMIRQAKEEERYTKQIDLKPDDVTIN
jgi:hypothetical protein